MQIINEPYDVLTLLYNHYENQVKFSTTYKKIPNFSAGGKPKTFQAYEIEPANPESETLTDMSEYGIASAIFFASARNARTRNCCVISRWTGAV